MTNNVERSFPKTTMALIAPFAIMLLIILFGARAAASQPTDELQAITVTEPIVEYQVVEKRTIQYVDRPVTVVEYIERVKEVPVELRNFSGLEELKQWLEDKRNVTTVRFQSPTAEIDCDDYALELQQKALTDGYVMSFEIIGRSEYNTLFTTKLPPDQSLHAMNLAIIGNDAYYIEPQTDEVVFALHLD